MTEIAVFPQGAPPEPVPGDWHGMFTSLHLALHRIAHNLPDPRIRRREASQHVWSVEIDPVPVPIAAGFGVLDVPQFFRPSLGEHWDVHRISATGFTAGSVAAWVNLPSLAAGQAVLAGALAASFPSAGVNTFGKAHCHLRGGNDRLVFVATGITGSVLVSMSATRVADEYWGEYLL